MTLYLVATPIGNLDDLTPRAAQTLRGASLIVAEDTRHSRKLLDRIGVNAPVRAFHDHSSVQDARDIVREADAGEVAFICDAGTPCISDPGYRLVEAAIAESVSVIPIPGPAAFVTFLSASGLPTDRFAFMGFLPPKGNAREEAVEALMTRRETTVVYESPRRLESLLEAFAARDSHRMVVVGRELTKKFEEYIRGSAAEVLAELVGRDTIRGECVVGVAPYEAPAQRIDDILPMVDAMIAEGVRTKSIAKVVASLTTFSRDEIYQLVLERS